MTFIKILTKMSTLLNYFQMLTSVWMRTCIIAQTSFTSASTLAARTNVNVNRTCTLLMANAEVITI